MHEILIVCDEEKEHSKSKPRSGEGGIHTGYLRSGMTVMNLASANPSSLLREARVRGCRVVLTRQVLREQLAAQLHRLTGRQVPAEVLDRPLIDMLEEDNGS